jgi:predicted ATP-grasp superfamily ATP-dependent carboligase
VIVAGGSHNALSIARSLGRRGVPVELLGRSGSEIAYTRYARFTALCDELDPEPAIERFLLGPESERLRGAVLLAAGDDALKVIAERHAELARRYRLDLCHPPAQFCMLDKLATYETARRAGVATPRFWSVDSRAEVEGLRGELVFPLIVKPRESHLFQRRFASKFLVAERFEELAPALEIVERAGVACLLVEKIPGPDSLLASYYTYLDEKGDARFEFTKRVLRRYPVNMGLATYHITDRIPALAEPTLALLREAGLRGVANVEYKLDRRDGRYKLIECNARFTAANTLLARSGIDLAWFVYCRAAGLPLPAIGSYRSGVRLWDPARDLKACRALHRSGEASVLALAKSLLRRQNLPVFSWRDPLPALMRLLRQGRTKPEAMPRLRPPREVPESGPG